MKAKDDERERRIRYLEDLIKDWARVFAEPSAALRSAGVTSERNSPSAVADMLVSAVQTAESLEKEKQHMHAAHAQQCAELRNSLTQSQHAAAQAHAAELSELRAQRDAALASERARADAAHKATQEMRNALAVQVAARTDEAVQTAVQAAESKASKRESQLSGDIEQLRSQLQAAQQDIVQLRNQLAQSQSASAAAASRAQAQLQAVEEQLRTAAAAAAEELKTTQQRAAAKMKEVQAHHAAMVDTQRVKLLETHGLWLAKRVSELQVLCDELQRALMGKSGTDCLPGTRGSTIGVPPGGPMRSHSGLGGTSDPPSTTLAGIQAQHGATNGSVQDGGGAQRAYVASIEGGRGGSQQPHQPSAPIDPVPTGGKGGQPVTYWYTRAATGTNAPPPTASDSVMGLHVQAAGDSLFHRFARTHEPTQWSRRAAERRIVSG